MEMVHDLLLLFGRELMPRRQVVQVLLGDQVAAALGGRVFLVDEGGCAHAAVLGIRRSIYEPQEISRDHRRP